MIRPPSAALQPLVLFAGIVAVLALTEAAQVYLGLGLLGVPVSWGTALRVTGPSWLVLFALAAPLIRWLDRRETPAESPPAGWRVVGNHLLPAGAFVTLHLAGTAFCAELLSPEPIGLRVRLAHLVSAYFVVDGLTYVAIVGTHAAVRRGREAARRDLVTVRQRAALSEARWRLLEGRLRPDFFFNTLNALSGLVARGESSVALTVLDAFGALMRASLATDDSESSLQEELALVEQYGSIQSVRYPDMVRVRCRVEDGVAGRTVPPLDLVARVERLVSGAVRLGRPVHVQLTARQGPDGVEIEIRDNAPGQGDEPESLVHVRNVAYGPGRHR